MKLFECLDGTLINPLLVTSITKTGSMPIEDIRITFAGNSPTMVYACSNKNEASGELKRFKDHFESIA